MTAKSRGTANLDGMKRPEMLFKRRMFRDKCRFMSTDNICQLVSWPVQDLIP